MDTERPEEEQTAGSEMTPFLDLAPTYAYMWRLLQVWAQVTECGFSVAVGRKDS